MRRAGTGGSSGGDGSGGAGGRWRGASGGLWRWMPRRTAEVEAAVAARWPLGSQIFFIFYFEKNHCNAASIRVPGRTTWYANFFFPQMATCPKSTSFIWILTISGLRDATVRSVWDQYDQKNRSPQI